MDSSRRTKGERLARKRELEEELRAIQAQKEAIDQRKSVLQKIVEERQAEREAAAAQAAARAAAAAEAAAKAAAQKQKDRAAQHERAMANGGKAGGKRPFGEPALAPHPPVALTPQEAYNAKKRQVELDRQRRLGSIWSQCSTILKALKKTTHSWPFHTPVDPVKLNIPDYFNIIKKPMDLGTIEKKLVHNPGKNITRDYNSPLEFRDDVRQVWLNCRTYNRPGQDVRKMGDRLSDSFEKKWAASDIENKLKDEKAIQTREELELAELEGKFASTAKGSDYAKKLRKLNEELTAELASKEPTKVEPTGKMTFEQKRRISVALGALPGDKLPRVLEIVSESIKASDYEDQEEVELDIDALDDDTLRKLQEYVDSVIPAHSVPKNLGSKSAGASKDVSGSKGAAGTTLGDNGHAAKAASDRDRTTTGGKAPTEADKRAVGGSEGGNKGSGSDSSSSSSGGSSSSSASDSDGGEQRGSTFNADGDDGATGGGGATGGEGGGAGEKNGGGVEMSALVSATGPRPGAGGHSILKTQTSKKEVNLQNAGAWASLTAEAQGDNDAADGEEGKEGKKGDELWSEFTAREQQQRRREQERKDEEKQLQEETAAREQEERAKAERARAEAAEEEEARKAKAREAEDDARRAREEERAKELAKLSNMGKGGVDLGVAGDDEDEHITPSTMTAGRMPNMAAMFGIGRKPATADEDDEAGGDAEDMEEDGEQPSGRDEDMEEGEAA